MNDDRINIVGVQCTCSGEKAADAEARFETEDGRALTLRMTRKAVGECAACCSVANVHAGAWNAPMAAGIQASPATVVPVPGSDRVVMALDVSEVGAAHFLLSQADAVVLAAQLLDASGAGREAK